MKTNIYILVSIFAAMFLASACRETDEYLPLPPQEEDLRYTTVPYSITVGITPMTEKIDGSTPKNTFIAGDAIKITNPKILAEPAILTSDNCVGKDKAVFSGELKVRLNVKLNTGSTNLAGALINTDTAANGILYNSGIPYCDVKEIQPNDLDKYCYWACENFTYNAEYSSINLVQNTIFVAFDMPVNGIKFDMIISSFHNTIITKKKCVFAVPFDSRIWCSLLGIDEMLDKKGKTFYKMSATLPKDCIPGVFTIGYGGNQAFFSKGNLQYRPLDGAWRLAPQQYHRCFDSDMKVGENYYLWSSENDWTDLFGWGMWLEGQNPASTSTNVVDYNLPVDEYDALIGACAYGTEWSVLDYLGWTYLRNISTMGQAKIIDIEGIVILPDDWSIPDGLTFDSKIVNEYSSQQWQMMEAAGAVFLPYEGYRSGSDIKFEQSCLYWSNSSYDNNNNGLYFVADKDGTAIYNTQYRYTGFMVRLVYDGLQHTDSSNPDDHNNQYAKEDRCIMVWSKDNAQNAWDSQFWIITGQFYKGQTFELTMSIKSDYESYAYGIQLQGAPGEYLCQLTNDHIHFTTEWTTVTLTGSMDNDGQCVAFNLNEDVYANKYYFDNISFKVDGVDVVVNGDCQSEDVNSFLKKDGDGRMMKVDFIEKSSILPAKPREIRDKEPGSTVIAYDFRSFDSYPYWSDGNMITPIIDSENGFVSEPQFNADGSRMWYQYFAANGVPVVLNKRYAIEVEIRGDEPGSFNADMGWDWNVEPVHTTVEFTTEWQVKRFEFDGPVPALRCNVIFQPGDFPSKIYVRTLKVIYLGD